MLCIFLTPPRFSDAGRAGEDPLSAAESGVLGSLYFGIDGESGPDVGSPFLRGASYDSRTQDRIYLCAGDAVSIADSYLAHLLCLQSWLPKPASGPEASKAELKLFLLVPGYQPPGCLPVKSAAGTVLTGSGAVREMLH